MLARHGATEWSRSGRHTGRTDLPLVEEGRLEAAALGRRISGRRFAAVLSSPLQRALSTCEIAGMSSSVEVLDELAEWDYGEYEGLTTEQIRARDPNWQVFVDGCPGGETPGHVAARADRVLARIASIPEDGGPDDTAPVLVFSHGHFLRVLAARWLELGPSEGRRLRLDTGTLSELGLERGVRAIATWNS